MAKRFDVVAPKKYMKNGQEMVQWNRIGVMWQDGEKMRLNLDVVPIGWDGFALISEPKEKQEAPGKPQRNSSSGGQPDEDIPW